MRRDASDYGYGISEEGSYWWEVDPVSASIPAGFVVPWGTCPTVAFCTLDDRFFAVAPDADMRNTSGNWALYEFVGGGWSLNTTITTGGGTGAVSAGGVNTIADVDRHQPALFKQPGQNKLIAIVIMGDSAGGGTNVGSQMWELTPSGSVFTPNNITNTVLPADLRPGGRGTGSVIPISDRWYPYMNNDIQPPVEEMYLAYIAHNGGTGYGIYTHIDTSTLWSSPTPSLGNTYSLPCQSYGGGGRINKGLTANQPKAQFGTAVLGAFRISYRVWGTNAGQTLSLYYSTGQETPITKGTIIAQTGGSGISGGSVTGITGDNGVTLFTLDWDIINDGVASGDLVHIMLKFD